MSSDSPLRIRGLQKRFGRTTALAGIDVQVPQGAIYGFVGLNGAGKTTTIECSLGLQRPTAGEVNILGGPPRRLPRSRGRVGVVFDAPCLHPQLTVDRALAHAALVTGHSRRSARERGEQLGLTRYRKVQVRRLSLGNRRRTSIACALVGAPELLILDEPFSGLDAEGVDDLLALLSGLHRDGNTTIVLSSHQLHHVEKICTHVGIIHEGTMVREDTRDEILADGTPELRIAVGNADRALAVLADRPDVRARREDDGHIIVELRGALPGEVNAALVRENVGVSELVPVRTSLESTFRDLVRGSS